MLGSLAKVEPPSAPHVTLEVTFPFPPTVEEVVAQRSSGVTGPPGRAASDVEDSCFVNTNISWNGIMTIHADQVAALAALNEPLRRRMHEYVTSGDVAVTRDAAA
jgi:hypothetical protein